MSVRKDNDYLKTTCGTGFQAERATFHGALFFFEGTMVIQIWVFHRHFLKNKQSQPITDVMAAMIKFKLSNSN